MNQFWINKSGNENCILFFNGWTMGSKAVEHLCVDEFDVCIFGSYKNFEAIKDDLGTYQNIYVVAWSLGVWAAARVMRLSNLKIVKSIAINGTQKAIDNSCGIPEAVYENTSKGWSERNRLKFQMRVFGGRANYMDLRERIDEGDEFEQKEELEFLKKDIQAYSDVDWGFDCTLVSAHDGIFPAKNQVRYWFSKARIVALDGAHYPFENFSSWNEIISL